MILVHEFVVGGGWSAGDPPESLRREGLAMLRAVLTDLRAWGSQRVVTTLDSRLASEPLPADEVVLLRGEVYAESLARLAARCDTALVIAPEAEGILERVTALVLEAGVSLLGSGLAAIAAASNKWLCYKLFRQAGLPTPETALVEQRDIATAVADIRFPLVIKPRQGAGCEGVGFASGEEALAEAVKMPALHRAAGFLVQRYVAGTPASVSLIVADGHAVALGLNEQWVRPGIPFSYEGGAACVDHERRSEAIGLAQTAVGLFPELRGYVGVDLILTDEGCQLVEINPRVTTAYLGLRQALPMNLAEALWRAGKEGVLPPVPQPIATVTFAKGIDW